MKIKKRDGRLEQLSIDKIIYRLKKLKNDVSLGKLTTIDTDPIALKIVSSIYDGVSSSELDEETARISISMTENLEYAKLASRIIVSNLHKNTSECFSDNMEKLYNNVDSNGVHAPVLSDAGIEFIRQHKDIINETCNYTRDYIFDYFGFKTLEKSYLMKLNGKVIERPQHLYMRVAIQVNLGDIDNVIKTYNIISQHLLTFASPTLFNSLGRLGNLSSCFHEDTIVATLNKGSIKIKDVQIGDSVITHLGNVKKVQQLHKNLLNNRTFYDLDIYKTPNIKVTNNHKLWACTKELKPQWISVDDLKIGDYVSIPNGYKGFNKDYTIDLLEYKNLIENKGTTGIEFKVTNTDDHIILHSYYQRKTKNQYTKNLENHDFYTTQKTIHNNINRFIKIDSDFARFLGIWYGDGCIFTNTDNKNKNRQIRGIGITIDYKNNKLIEWCSEYMKNTFGNLNISKSGKSCYNLTCTSVYLGLVFEELFGKGFDKKKIFKDSWQWDISLINELVCGLLCSDGGMKKDGLIQLSMTNPLFMEELYYLLRNYGIDVSLGNDRIQKYNSKIYKTMSLPKRKEYITALMKTYTDDRIEKVLKLLEDKNRVLDNKTKIINDKIFLRVTNKTQITENLPEYVYTLGVEDDHSYNVGGIVAENCFLIGTQDSVQGIFKTMGDIAQISKVGGGIGLHIDNIRSKGSVVRGTNGYSDGIVPMLKVYNEVSTYINQGSRRKGSFAIYLSPSHPDIMEFLDLRKNQGSESLRARDLFYAMWIPDLFMEQLKIDSDWYLMDPDECPGLNETYGEDYEKLYWKYVEEKKYRKQIKAQEIWIKILESQIETGNPYILYKDQINKKSNQKNIGVIKSSNLCVSPETMILTSNGYYKIKELEGQNIKIWNGEEFTNTIVQKTGEDQELIKIKFSNGSELECTPYHKFYIATGKRPSDYPMIRKIDAKDLTKNMKLIKSEFPIIKEGLSDFPYPYEHGIFSADGTLESKKDTIFQCNYKSIEGNCYCGYHIKMYEEKDTDIPTIYCKGIVGKGNPRITLYGEKKKLVKYITSRLEILPEDNGKRINIRLPMNLKPKFEVPINYNLDIKLRWLEGLSDGDGCIRKSDKLTGIQISSIDKEFLENVKYLLQTLGCDPKIVLMHEEGLRLLPSNDGTDELSEYNCQTCYRLLITSWDTSVLYKLGFRPKRLNISGIFPKNNTKRWIQVENIIKTNRISDTFCFKEEKRGMGIFNGILTGQCAEITLYSDDKQYAVCNLSSVALPKFIKTDKDNKKYFDHQELFETVKYLILPMNNVIDFNYYPVPETKLSNLRHRPIGIGTQGWSLVLTTLGIPFESEQADKLNKEIWETMYFGSLTGSMELAKKDGPYETFKGSPLSEGKFQFDLWAEYNNIDPGLSGRWDWEDLRKEIITHGVRNSTLLSQMPTASSASIMNNTESVECFDSCIYKRRVLSGEYVVCNKSLVKDLTDLNLWNKELKDLIIANNGSVQNIDIIPQNIKDIYKTVWEISMKSVINQAASRGVFMCQTQSMNLFVSAPTIKKLSSMHMYAYSKHLKTGMYYLRSKSAANSAKFSIEPTVKTKENKTRKSAKKQEPSAEEVLMCSINNREACDLCTS